MMTEIVTWDYEERKHGGEDAARHDLTLGHAGDHRQGQTKPEEVRPVDLHQVQSLVQLYSLAEPLVLETVEWVEQTLVDKVERGADDLDGEEREHVSLQQEYELHHQREDCVRDHHWQR